MFKWQLRQHVQDLVTKLVMTDFDDIIKGFLSIFHHHLTLFRNLIDLLKLLVLFKYAVKSTEFTLFWLPY